MRKAEHNDIKKSVYFISDFYYISKKRLEPRLSIVAQIFTPRPYLLIQCSLLIDHRHFDLLRLCQFL